MLPKLKKCGVYNSLYTQAVAYTTYFELGGPVAHPVILAGKEM